MLATPFREVTRSVKKRSDDDPILPNAVKQPVVVHKHFSNHGIADLRDNASAVSQRGQAFGQFERTYQHSNGAVDRIFCDVVERVVEGPGRLGPNYPARPSNHLRRNSAATCSCGITRSAFSSASPNATAWTTYR